LSRKILFFLVRQRRRAIINVFIGISFYNDEEFIEQAILSVINQKYNDWKLVLINDGSSDKSCSIAKKYVCEQIILISDGENKGLISRLNQLIDLADAEIFVRMDADDIMLPDRLLMQVAYLHENQDVDLVGSAAYIIDENNNVISMRNSNKVRESISEVIKYGMFIHPSVTGRTAWFKKNKYCKGFNRAEDLELWCRTFNVSKFHVLDEPLIYYRDPLSLNIEKYIQTHKSIIKIIRTNIDNRKDKVRLVAREKVKINLYRILHIFSLTQLIYTRRNPEIEISLKEEANRKLIDSTYKEYN